MKIIPYGSHSNRDHITLNVTNIAAVYDEEDMLYLTLFKPVMVGNDQLEYLGIEHNSELLTFLKENLI